MPASASSAQTIVSDAGVLCAADSKRGNTREQSSKVALAMLSRILGMLWGDVAIVPRCLL
eukprot:1967844-Amphidinium_carterae.3